MDGRGTYQFKRKTPNNSPLQIYLSKKIKPIVMPIPEVDFIYSSTQFEGTEVSIESKLKHTYDPDHPIISIDPVPYLVPHSQI